MKKEKYYVIWEGLHTGIVDSWAQAMPLVQGYRNAKYKSFTSLEEAQKAFKLGWHNFYSQQKSLSLPEKLFDTAICVDVACSGNSGVMEYRGVEPYTRAELFRKKFFVGTNNIGEFLAIVHGLILIQKHSLPFDTIYSDSKVAIQWVEKKAVHTKLPRRADTELLWQAVECAVNWLHQNTYFTVVKKWETEKWGENPADFGRKK
ncbi:MAG: ribonuclease H family protein [Bacteroidia bacterium]|nr:ribonuclease H family protein [Bacteroidia bacterium]MDW8346203.1 ribonuclease H family protein [Bacteroidia bacterium]